MSAHREPLTAADIAEGLRALADLIDEHGLPDDLRHADQAPTFTKFVASRAAVEEFAARHGLTVEQHGTHTTTSLSAGRLIRPGTVGLTIVHIAKDEPEPEPTTTGVDLFDCPEPGCGFAIGAAGPVDPDDPYAFEEEVREHQRSHDPEPEGEPADIGEDDGVPLTDAEMAATIHAGMDSVRRRAERCAYCAGRGTYTAHKRYPQGGGGTNVTVTCRCPAGRVLKAQGDAASPPPLVQLDRAEAAARVLDAAMAYEAAHEPVLAAAALGVDDTAEEDAARHETAAVLRAAAREYRESIGGAA